MTDLVVITPSRGRPQQLQRLAVAVARTTEGRASVLGLVDDDDPQRDTYLTLAEDVAGLLNVIVCPAGGDLVYLTNIGARVVVNNDVQWLASLGDDHLPRTQDWDLHLTGAVKAMNGPGWAYGNDLLQGEALPTAWVQHADTVRALGWMMPPTLGHMYPDNVVRDLGKATGRLAYVPGVVIEHLHPAAAKAPTDESYQRSNSAARFAADRDAYLAWHASGFPADQAKIAALTWAGVPC